MAETATKEKSSTTVLKDGIDPLSATAISKMSEKQRKHLYDVFVRIGRKLAVVEKQPPPLSSIDAVINADGSFADAACVLVVNYLQANEMVIVTAIAAEVVDVVRGEVIFSKNWKIRQLLCPRTAASMSNMELQQMLSLVCEHEKKYGYYFVDRSQATFMLSTVTRAVGRMVALCGLGCYSQDHEKMHKLFRVAVNPLPDSIREADTVQRSTNIVQDLALQSKLVVKALRASLTVHDTSQVTRQQQQVSASPTKS